MLRTSSAAHALPRFALSTAGLRPGSCRSMAAPDTPDLEELARYADELNL